MIRASNKTVVFAIIVLVAIMCVSVSQFNYLILSRGTTETEQCSFVNYIFGQPVNQTDPCLVRAFKEIMLILPPPQNSLLNQDRLNSTSEIPSNVEKLKWVEKLIIQQLDGTGTTPGFFIECGANDGEFISPTLRLEKTYNWKGLLIEANPIPFQELLKKKRNAWAVNAALCTSERPQPVAFFTYPENNNTGVSGLTKSKTWGESKAITVPCIPLFTILLALNIQVVDYLSLDVEGAELAILKTLPFDKIMFKIMTVEYNHIKGGSKALSKFLKSKGYMFVKQIRDITTKDNLYVHDSLYSVASKIKI